MRNFNRIAAFIMAVLLSGAVFAQNKGPKEKQKEDAPREDSRTDGMKKITTSNHRNRNINVHIDEEALEKSIASSIETAMRSMEVELDKMEIHIEPIEIDLSSLNTTLESLEINIPDMDIRIEPIEIDLSNLDTDLNFDFNTDQEDDNDDEELDNDDERNNEEEPGTIIKQKDKVKDNTDKKEKDKPAKEVKDKSKGLKKIN